MIGKKAAIGIIAATGVVTVGVPVGIVVGQHASKTGSLDSKMQSKWSDIEKELASSFGGFEIRDKDIVEQKQKDNSVSETELKTKRLLVQRIIGAGVPEYDPNDKDGKTAFYNNLISQEKKIQSGFNKFSDVIQSILTGFANDYLSYNIATNTIGVRTVGNQAGASVAITKVGDDWKIQGLSFNSVSIPFTYDIDATVVKEDDQSILANDGTAVKVVIKKDQVQKMFMNMIGNFTKTLDAIADDSNILDIEQNAVLMLDSLTSDKQASLKSIIGDGASGKNVSSALGIKTLLEALKTGNKDFAHVHVQDLLDQIKDITSYFNRTLLETQLSIEGHHDEKLNNKYIENLTSFPQGKGFLNQKFQDEILTPLATDPQVIDHNLAQLLPKDASISDISFFASQLQNNDNPRLDFGDIDSILDVFVDNWNFETKSYVFKNAEAIQWQKESAKTYDNVVQNPDGSWSKTVIAGENLAALGADIRINKIKNSNSSDWLIRLQYELLWNKNKFNAVMQKYNLKADSLYMDLDTNGAKQTISSTAGDKFTFNELFKNELVNTANKPTLNSLYPLASSEWVDAGYWIAQSVVTPDISVQGALSANALREFRITQETKITFRLKIANSEIGKIYENNANRNPLAFTLNADGELYVNDRIEGGK